MALVVIAESESTVRIVNPLSIDPIKSHDQRVHYVYQSHLFGTAHASQVAIDAVPEIVEAPFLLSATEYLMSREFFWQQLQFSASRNGGSSVIMKELDPSGMASRSSVRFNADQSIAEIVEKPVTGTAHSSIGANLTFILPPEILLYMRGVPIFARGEQEVQHAINAWISNDGLAFGKVQPVPSEWQPPVAY